MIIQKYQQGKNEIKVESAESVKDAKDNNFTEGTYSRYYVNGKQVSNYMSMIKFIIEETKTNKTNIIPNKEESARIRKEMFQRQHAEISNQLQELKKQYSTMDIPQDALDKMNDYIDKLDPITNMRVVK